MRLPFVLAGAMLEVLNGALPGRLVIVPWTTGTLLRRGKCPKMPARKTIDGYFVRDLYDVPEALSSRRIGKLPIGQQPLRCCKLRQRQLGGRELSGFSHCGITICGLDAPPGGPVDHDRCNAKFWFRD